MFSGSRAGWFWSSMEMGSSPSQLLGFLLSTLRAQALLYQNLHWEARGPSYYGDHLLYQRLYDAVQEDVDLLAEKLVQSQGESAVDLLAASYILKKMVQRWASGSLVEKAHRSESDLLAMVDYAFNALKDRGLLSLGMDDYLMSLYNKHEGHMYLIGQRRKRAASDLPIPEEETDMEVPTDRSRPDPQLTQLEKAYGGYTVEAPRRTARKRRTR